MTHDARLSKFNVDDPCLLNSADPPLPRKREEMQSVLQAMRKKDKPAA